jgi:membrane protease YdiL (CAAX protease family)
VATFLADTALVTGVGAAAKALLPATPQLPDFVAMCAGILGLVALLSVLGWWGLIGFNRPTAWRNLHLLWLPALAFIALPFVSGVGRIDTGNLAFLVVGYALTGFYEEALFRGLLLRVLAPLGVRRAVLLSALLFGCAHLVNVLFRNPAIVFAQALGAATEGVGLAALRVRTNTLWPLIALHALEDLLLHFGRLPTIPVNVAQSVILFAYGLWLLGGLGAARARGTAAPAPAVGR